MEQTVKQRIMAFLDKKDIKTATFLSRMNKALKKAVAGISTYWSRHTVASIAAEIDIPLDIIAKLPRLSIVFKP